MTPEEIAALPVGRQLDALIAERVMGCRVAATDRGLRCDCAPDYPHNDPDWEGAPSLCDYSTRATDAFRVIEHLRAAGWEYALQGEKGGGHVCEFWKGDVHQFARKDSAPHAICAGALLAVGEAAP